MNHSSDRSQLFKEAYDSLEGLADRIGEILDCPITIEDSNHRIIAYSTHDEKVDAARIATIVRRRVPENVINALWKNGVMQQLFTSDEPVNIPAIDKIGLGNRIAVSVRKKEDVLGFIWAQLDDKPFNEEKIELLKEAAKLVKNQLLQHQIKKRKVAENYKEFFWRLLTGHTQKINEINQSASQFGLKLDGPLAIAIIEFNSDVDQPIEEHSYYLIETLQQVQVICRIFDENQLILLTRIKSTDTPTKILTDFVQNFITKISDRLNINDVNGACGLVYDSPQYIKDSYKEALKVLKIKEKFPSELTQTFSYQELGIYQFLEELYSIRIRDNYKNYAIEKLREYDQKHHSNLITTLKTYLEYDSNVQEAAKVLHIHTNTMTYRLKRITDIAEINLKDPNQKLTFYLDLKMENMKSEDL